MRIAVFLDGRPGHEKQSRGIIAALRCYEPVETEELCLPPTEHCAQSILQYIQYFCKIESDCAARVATCDLLLGTGRRTHLPMLFCKRKYSIPACTCMSPDPLLRNQFDLCFVPRHDRIPSSKNIFLTTGPPNTAATAGMHIDTAGLILIGGEDRKSHHWDSQNILNCIEKIVCHDTKGIWYISSSPRTPLSMLPQLYELAARYSACTFVEFKDTPPGWVEKKYAESRQVWVTADSISMVYEALSAGCQVGLIPVSWKKKENKFELSEQYLVQNRYITRYEDWQKSGSLRNSPTVLNEADTCAKEILRRWFHKS